MTQPYPIAKAPHASPSPQAPAGKEGLLHKGVKAVSEEVTCSIAESVFGEMPPYAKTLMCSATDAGLTLLRKVRNPLSTFMESLGMRSFENDVSQSLKESGVHGIANTLGTTATTITAGVMLASAAKTAIAAETAIVGGGMTASVGLATAGLSVLFGGAYMLGSYLDKKLGISDFLVMGLPDWLDGCYKPANMPKRIYCPHQ